MSSDTESKSQAASAEPSKTASPSERSPEREQGDKEESARTADHEPKSEQQPQVNNNTTKRELDFHNEERSSQQHSSEEGEEEEEEEGEEGEATPPLPDEPLPVEDDGWTAAWDDNAQAYYFHNRFSGMTQWQNPRVPNGSGGGSRHSPAGSGDEGSQASRQRPHGGYDPSVHGDYDPTAPYAIAAAQAEEKAAAATAATVYANAGGAAISDYSATGAFNRFTGKWQASSITSDMHNDDNKSRRQMNAFFDVDAAANSHNGRSLKAERSGKKLSRQELKAFRERRKERKEEKRRAWLRD